MIDQLLIDPTSPAVLSAANKFHVPFVGVPDNAAKFPAPPSGLKVPAKGAAPAVIAVTAVAEKHVPA